MELWHLPRGTHLGIFRFTMTRWVEEPICPEIDPTAVAYVPDGTDEELVAVSLGQEGRLVVEYSPQGSEVRDGTIENKIYASERRLAFDEFCRVRDSLSRPYEKAILTVPHICDVFAIKGVFRCIRSFPTVFISDQDKVALKKGVDFDLAPICKRVVLTLAEAAGMNDLLKRAGLKEGPKRIIGKTKPKPSSTQLPGCDTIN